MSHQRWHTWRNMDDTTCPSNGIVRTIPPVYFFPAVNAGRTDDIFGGPVPGGGFVDFSHSPGFTPFIASRNFLNTDAELLSTQELAPIPAGVPPVEGAFANTFFPGTQLILHGKRPNYAFFSDDLNPYTQRGAKGFALNMAFNSNAPVAPGELGLLTWDTPVWVAIGGTVLDGPGTPPVPVFVDGMIVDTFGSLVTVFDDWKGVCVGNFDVLLDRTGCLYTLASDVNIKRNYIGAGVVYAIDPNPDD